MLPLVTAAPCVAQVLEGGPEEDLEHLALLLQFLEEETAAHRNFEFVQVRLTTEAGYGGCLKGRASLLVGLC